MTQLQNAVVLLTGAAGGFGQQFTRQLLQAGSHLILSDRDETQLQQVVRAIEADLKHAGTPVPGSVLATFAADLARPDGAQDLYDRALRLNRPLDILINNAGIGLYGRMDEVPRDKWEQLMQVNLLAPMRLSTAFAADAIARRQGHIVNISSIAGWVTPAGLAHYGSSKYGLRGFSEGLREELKPYGIKVTGVYPFFSRTPILQAAGYGSLAQTSRTDLEQIATDPARVIACVLRAIARDRPHVFPDRVAQLLHRLKRYAPGLLTWGNDRVQAFPQRGAGATTEPPPS